MDCFVGASTGALKGLNFCDGSFNNITPIETLKPKKDEITSIAWFGPDQTEVLTAQLDHQMKLYDTASNTYSRLFNVDTGSGAIKGVHVMESRKIVTAVESGELSVWQNNGELIREINAGENLLTMTSNSCKKWEYATGGNENPLKVWDIETGDKIFTAKNVRPDSLQLRVPVWETNIRFIPNSENIVTTTGKSQIRVYDPRAQRRPVCQLEWLEGPLTALSLSNVPMRIIAGNTRGEIGQFDLRKCIRLVSKLKGFAGAVRDLQSHPESPYVASCSVDRFVRLHDADSRKLVKKIYCKARLNRLIIRDDFSLSKANNVKKEKLEELEDWMNMSNEITDESEASSMEEDLDLGNDMKTSEKAIFKRKESVDDAADATQYVQPSKKFKLVNIRKRSIHEAECDSTTKSDKDVIFLKKKKSIVLKRKLALEQTKTVSHEKIIKLSD